MSFDLETYRSISAKLDTTDIDWVTQAHNDPDITAFPKANEYTTGQVNLVGLKPSGLARTPVPRVRHPITETTDVGIPIVPVQLPQSGQ
jgi:hypothetical protein